jgi:hypothetical protein
MNHVWFRLDHHNTQLLTAPRQQFTIILLAKPRVPYQAYIITFLLAVGLELYAVWSSNNKADYLLSTHGSLDVKQEIQINIYYVILQTFSQYLFILAQITNGDT